MFSYSILISTSRGKHTFTLLNVLEIQVTFLNKLEIQSILFKIEVSIPLNVLYLCTFIYVLNIIYLVLEYY